MHRILFIFLILAAVPLELAAEGESVPKVEAVTKEDAARQEAALALIPFQWKQLGFEIVFMPPRKGYRAMTFASKKRIEVYARPGDDARAIAQDIAHELGHAIDLVHNNKEIRNRWMQSRGIDPTTPWFTCKQCSDYNSPSGDFAETFALLLLGREHYRGRIAAPPNEEKLLDLLVFFPIAFLQSN